MGHYVLSLRETVQEMFEQAGHLKCVRESGGDLCRLT